MVDVSDDGALRQAVGALVGAPLHVAVWTPGLFDWGRADEADPATWRALMEVNLTAPAVFPALVAPLLVSAAPSSLVYLGSGAGLKSPPGSDAAGRAAGLAAGRLRRRRGTAVRHHLISLLLPHRDPAAANALPLSPPRPNRRQRRVMGWRAESRSEH